MATSERKIKVAFFAEILIRDFDGASRTMYQLIDRIPRDRYEYYFFCGTPPDHDHDMKVFATKTITIPFNKTYSASLPHLQKRELLDELKAFAPDVIHIATPSLLGNFALSFAERQNIPVLTIYHTHFISYMQYYFKKAPFLVGIAETIVARSYRRFYNRCDMVYVPTSEMIKDLERRRIDRHRLKLWQRGMNHDLFNPSKKDTALIQSITGNDKPTILYASRLVWEKNVATLIRIYEETKARNLSVNWLVAGNGVAEQAAAEKMTDAHFLGHVDHERLSRIYASSDIFVFPSISETYGNVVVEAMASGCVCVIARGGGSQSLVEDGVTGYLCSPNDVTTYVDAIEDILQNEDKKNTMIAEGIKYTAHLDWDILAGEYFEDIRELSQT